VLCYSKGRNTQGCRHNVIKKIIADITKDQYCKHIIIHEDAVSRVILLKNIIKKQKIVVVARKRYNLYHINSKKT